MDGDITPTILRIKDSDGRPVNVQDLDEDARTNVQNYELGYVRGWREALAAAAQESAKAESAPMLAPEPTRPRGRPPRSVLRPHHRTPGRRVSHAQQGV